MLQVMAIFQLGQCNTVKKMRNLPSRSENVFWKSQRRLAGVWLRGRELSGTGWARAALAKALLFN